MQRDAAQDLYYSSEHTWAKKEANGPDLLDELKEKEPRLVQFMTDVDWIITHWQHGIVLRAMGEPT